MQRQPSHQLLSQILDQDILLLSLHPPVMLDLLKFCEDLLGNFWTPFELKILMSFVVGTGMKREIRIHGLESG